MRLPSFSNLIAFDAVGRHGTLTRAAAELKVSQPAISRRIAALELDIGHPLFDRTRKPLSMTRAGSELFDVLRSGLHRLEGAISRIQREATGSSVTISVDGGLAAYWLIPRLTTIQAAFPHMQLRILSESETADARAASDLQIRFGDGAWHGMDVSKLFGESVFPVCSPQFLDRRHPPFSAAELGAARLLDMKRGLPPCDWTSWFEKVGQTPPRRLDVVLFDSYVLVVSAAIAGQGICLAWNGILDDCLASGTLVRVSPLTAASSKGYYLTHDGGLSAQAPAREIARLLTACANS